MEHGSMTLQQKIDEAANNYNKTKDPYYRDQWYKLVERFYNGTNNTERRVVPINTRNKKDVRRLIPSRSSWLNLL